MENEIWKPITGYEKLYSVSNMGRFKSLEKGWISGIGKKYGTRKEKIIKGVVSFGYIRIGLYKNSKSKIYSTHRIVAQHFLQNTNNKPCVNHKNGIKNDNRVENLEWVTYSENEKHSFEVLGKKSRQGEKCSWSKLTERQVLNIRYIFSAGKITAVKLGEYFNVSRSAISDIVKRKRWAHI